MVQPIYKGFEKTLLHLNLKTMRSSSSIPRHLLRK